MPPSNESRSRLHRLLPEQRSPHQRGHLRWLVFLCMLLLGMLISWFIYDSVAKDASNDLLLRFEREAGQIEATLQSQFDLSFEYLLAIPPFFQASDDVSPADFRNFVSDALKRHPGIHTFEFLPKVAAAERASFEAAAQQQLGIRNFQIRAVDQLGSPAPLGDQDVYFPVYYGEPSIERVLGIDIASHPEQGPYVERVRSSTSPIATSPLSLIEDPPETLSVIAFAPARELSARDTSDCFGIAVLILRVRPVVESAMGSTRMSEFQFQLIDTDAIEGRKLVYKNYPGESLSKLRPGWPDAWRKIRFADQSWEFHVSPGLGSEFAPGRSPYWILLAGFALSVLGAYSISATVMIGGLRKQVDEALELGQYRLGRKLGEGGMGVVYEAEHRMLARPAAIKLIQLDPNESQATASSRRELRLSRFEKEAKATARLESPNTISIYDFGKTPSGEFYYVMELLEGTDLATLIKQFGPIPPARMIHLARQACRSLAEAHQAGLTHRDIKPANIFICRFALQYDFVKVLDFGLVKSSDQEHSVDVTQPGALIGTPAYIAPEMLVGGKVDGRSDIYSLGCVMVWLLTGKAPFVGQTPTAVMAQHLNRTPESPRSLLGDVIPQALDEIVMRCLEKQPANRPQSAEQLEQLLASCAEQMPWTQLDAEKCWQVESRLRDIAQASDTEPDVAAIGTILEVNARLD